METHVRAPVHQDTYLQALGVWLALPPATHA